MRKDSSGAGGKKPDHPLLSQILGPIVRFLAGSTAFLSLLTRIRLPSTGWILLFLPKLVASAISPLLFVLGLLSSFSAWLLHDHKSMGMGLAGALLSLGHIRRVATVPDALRRDLGPSWQRRIPSERRRLWLERPYTPRLLIPPDVPHRLNQVVGTHVETNTPLLADLWLPPDQLPHSGLAAIFLHSSGWHYMDKDFLTRIFFRHLANQGHVIMDLAYSLAPNNAGDSRKSPLQAMLADVIRGIVWLKKHAAELGFDPERVALIGASGGAHLALLATCARQENEFRPSDVGDADTSVCGIVSYYGLADLQAEQAALQHMPRAGRWAGIPLHLVGILSSENPFTDIADFIPSLLGYPPEGEFQRYRQASPIHYVGPHCPPTLFIHGAHDFGVNPRQSRRLYHAFRRAGVPAVLIELPETEHIFDLPFEACNPAFQVSTYFTERFLDWLLVR